MVYLYKNEKNGEIKKEKKKSEKLGFCWDSNCQLVDYKVSTWPLHHGNKTLEVRSNGNLLLVACFWLSFDVSFVNFFLLLHFKQIIFWVYGHLVRYDD